MKNLSISHVNTYTSKKTGKTMFVYEISGDEQSIQDYAESKGDFFVTDKKTGVPLYFTTRYEGKIAQLKRGDKAWFVDQEYLTKLASLAKRFGLELAREMLEEEQIEEQAPDQDEGEE